MRHPEYTVKPALLFLKDKIQAGIFQHSAVVTVLIEIDASRDTGCKEDQETVDQLTACFRVRLMIAGRTLIFVFK